MKSSHGLVPALLCIAFAAGPGGAAADEGEKVYQQTCTQCHNAKTRPLDSVRLTRDKWNEAIERMESQGAEVPSGKKRSDLLDFLTRTHGPDSPAPSEKK